MVYAPAVTFVHDVAYGAAVTRPSKLPLPLPFLNSTATIVPSASAAAAARLIVEAKGNLAPSLGEVSATLGGWFAPRSVNVDALEIVVRPWSSVAFAVME